MTTSHLKMETESTPETSNNKILFKGLCLTQHSYKKCNYLIAQIELCKKLYNCESFKSFVTQNLFHFCFTLNIQDRWIGFFCTRQLSSTSGF